MRTSSKSVTNLIRSDDGVATLTLTCAKERNFIDNALIAEILYGLNELSQDTGLRCLVLRGEGPIFSGGGRIQWLRSASALSADANLTECLSLVELFSRLNEFPVPVLACVHGAAIGGAVALVCACDIAIATSETIFSLSEARLGLIPACAAPFVLSKIGLSWTRRLFVTGERFSAAQALDIGLVHEVVPTHEDLDVAAASVISNILKCAPQATRAAKRLLLDLSRPERRETLDDVHEFVAHMLAKQRTEPEAQEGMEAFLSKRSPSWRPKL